MKLQAELRGSMKQELAMQQMPTSGLANPTLPPRHHGHKEVTSMGLGTRKKLAEQSSHFSHTQQGGFQRLQPACKYSESGQA